MEKTQEYTVEALFNDVNKEIEHFKNGGGVIKKVKYFDEAIEFSFESDDEDENKVIVTLIYIDSFYDDFGNRDFNANYSSTFEININNFNYRELQEWIYKEQFDFFKNWQIRNEKPCNGLYSFGLNQNENDDCFLYLFAKEDKVQYLIGNNDYFNDEQSSFVNELIEKLKQEDFKIDNELTKEVVLKNF